MITSSIKLSALKHIVQNLKNKNGDDVECIVIPITTNHLKKDKNGNIFLNMVHFPMTEPKEFGDHTIKQSLTKAEREEFGEQYVKELPIIGNSKNKDQSPQQAPQQSPQQNKDYSDGWNRI